MTQYGSNHRSPVHATRDSAPAGIVADASPDMARHGRHDGEGRVAHLARESGQEATPGPLASQARRSVARVGIMGAGVIGAGIARSLLEADIPVTIFDPARDALDEATASMRAHCRHAFLAGELTAAQRDRRVALLAGTVNLHHLKDCDVIVEALDIDQGTKEALLRRLDEIARPGAILAAFTPTVDIEPVARLTRFPHNVLGLRLSPRANTGQAWEFVPGKATSAEALATATALIGNLCQPPEGYMAPQTEGLQ